MTSRIATMPRIPPVSTTHVFRDIATATRIESTENAMLISSTLTTVPHNAREAEPGFGRLRPAALLVLAR